LKDLSGRKIKKAIEFAKGYLKYLIKSKHYKGHGIHSPFLYDFLMKVVFSNKKGPLIKQVNTAFKEYRNNKTYIDVEDYGAGSQIYTGNRRKIKDIVKSSSTKKKYGKLLFRLVDYYSPQNILEIGTSLGVGTLYLAISGKANIYTIEGDKSIHSHANNLFKRLNLTNVKSINAQFDTVLPGLLNKIDGLGLVFFDGNHRLEPTLRYFELCLEKIDANSIFVFDDIHWSKEMEKAWEQIKSHNETRVTVDLFKMGIVFFDKKLNKQHYTVFM